jgi:hypothetical protein
LIRVPFGRTYGGMYLRPLIRLEKWTWIIGLEGSRNGVGHKLNGVVEERGWFAAFVGWSPLVGEHAKIVVPLWTPHFCTQRQFVQLGSGLTPRWIVLVHEGQKAFAMRRRNEMRHFVHHHVLQQILRLLDQLGV